MKRDGAIKIPGGGRILFDITLVEVEDGETQKLHQWEPATGLSWESTQVSALDYGKVVTSSIYTSIFGRRNNLFLWELERNEIKDLIFQN